MHSRQSYGLKSHIGMSRAPTFGIKKTDPSGMTMSTTHTFLRELRAVARNIQAGTRPNFPAAFDALEIWRSSMPAPGRRIFTLMRAAKTAHRRDHADEALGMLSVAIKMVELASKETYLKSKPRSAAGAA